MRLDAFIAAATGESRSIAKKYIKEKRVTLSGNIAKSPAENTDGKIVTLDGKTYSMTAPTYICVPLKKGNNTLNISSYGSYGDLLIEILEIIEYIETHDPREDGH